VHSRVCLCRYDAPLALEALRTQVLLVPECHGQAELMLRLAVELAPKVCASTLGRKLSALGACAALRCPDHALVQPQAAQLITVLLGALDATAEALKGGTYEEAEESDDENLKADPDDKAALDEEADVEESDEEDGGGEYLQELARKANMYAYDDDDDDDDDYDDSGDYQSPLDGVDSLRELGVTLQLLEQRGLAAAVTTQLSPEQKQRLQAYYAQAANLPPAVV